MCYFYAKYIVTAVVSPFIFNIILIFFQCMQPCAKFLDCFMQETYNTGQQY